MPQTIGAKISPIEAKAIFCCLWINPQFFITTMALTKEQKKQTLDYLKEKIAEQKAMIFVSIEKVKVKNLSGLRKDLKQKNCEIKVAKKTLMKLAFKEKGIELDLNSLPGEVGLVFGYKDEVLPAKTVYNFIKGLGLAPEDGNLRILGGFLENKFQGSEEIITLAQLPSREELLAKLVGSISAPVANFVNVLQGNLKGLVVALNAISKTK